jgi:uncharacterized protein (TIGR03435 family)
VKTKNVRRFYFVRTALIGAAAALAPVSLTNPAAVAQNGNDMSHFEVVSIRLNEVLPPDPHPCIGGPGTQSPTLWMCNSVAYAGLIGPAFGLETYQYHYQTTQMKVDTYSISARLPQGATEEQFREMRRNMLEERFGLKWHWKESDGAVYRLVRDPGGVKLHESAPDAAPAVKEYGKLPPETKLGKDRYPVWPEGVPGLVQMANHNRWRSSNVTTADIAYVLRYELKTDVIDGTGLTGHYDVDLRWETPPIEYFASAPPYEGPEAKTEFRDKLGLRLEPVKGKIKTFVVDHIDRVPTEN